ncbi:MAG TPA: HIT family protein [Vicinamibacterales bacterium]|nr:HIT family protein [Vicinamibacterales bacterium]
MTPIFEDDDFLIEPAAGTAVPGYVVLRMRSGVSSLAELDAAAARRLGEMLARASRAVQAATAADRVYCLSFCEIDRQLHFHLFPRAAWLLDAYWTATGEAGEPVNGPLLFEWARTLGDRLMPPSSTPSAAEVCDILRARLR